MPSQTVLIGQRVYYQRGVYLKAASLLQAVREGLGKVLEAVGTATVFIGLVQQHFTKVIQPQVEASTGEAAACNSGLSALVKATEERVLTSLQAALNALLAQVGCEIVTSVGDHAVLLYLATARPLLLWIYLTRQALFCDVHHNVAHHHMCMIDFRLPPMLSLHR